MTRDRLQALTKASFAPNGTDPEDVAIDITEGAPAAGGSTAEETPKMRDFFADVGQVRELIEEVKKKVAQVETLQGDVLKAAGPNENLQQQLAQSISDAKNTANRVRAKLKLMEELVKKQKDPNSATSRMMASQYSSLIISYSKTMKYHSDVMNNFRQKCKERLKRQLDIASPHGNRTSDTDVDNMLESGSVEVFTKGIFKETAEAQKTLQDIEARHEDIMKLENSILELHDMFMDMALLVESQGEMIESIENNVGKTEDFVKKAVKDTEQAVVSRNSAVRKKMCCCTCISVLLVVGAVVLFFSICFGGELQCFSGEEAETEVETRVIFVTYPPTSPPLTSPPLTVTPSPPTIATTQSTPTTTTTRELIITFLTTLSTTVKPILTSSALSSTAPTPVSTPPLVLSSPPGSITTVSPGSITTDSPGSITTDSPGSGDGLIFDNPPDEGSGG